MNAGVGIDHQFSFWQLQTSSKTMPPHITADADGGTDLLAVHENLPQGLSAADNETGWRMSLAKLAMLVE